MPGPIMKCGHAAQGKDGDGNWGCVICWPDPRATQIDDTSPDLTGRRARCSYYGTRFGRKNECGTCGKTTDGICRCERDSDPKRLAFFEHRPGEEFDRFYCGCSGWD